MDIFVEVISRKPQNFSEIHTRIVIIIFYFTVHFSKNNYLPFAECSNLNLRNIHNNEMTGERVEEYSTT